MAHHRAGHYCIGGGRAKEDFVNTSQQEIWYWYFIEADQTLPFISMKSACGVLL